MPEPDTTEAVKTWAPGHHPITCTATIVTASAWVGFTLPDDDGANDRQRRHVTHALENPHQRAVGEAAVARHDGRHRDEVVRGLYVKHGLDPAGIAASVRKFLNR